MIIGNSKTAITFNLHKPNKKKYYIEHWEVRYNLRRYLKHIQLTQRRPGIAGGLPLSRLHTDTISSFFPAQDRIHARANLIVKKNTDKKTAADTHDYHLLLRLLQASVRLLLPR